MPAPRTRTKVWPFVVVGFLLVAAIGVANRDTTPTSSSVTAPAPAASAPVLTVTRIVDGDTVDLSDGRRVRLLGVDAPEAGECGYAEATGFARTTLLNQPVDATADSTQATVDGYGRVLLYLGVGGRDFSVATAGAGWAERYASGTPVQKDAAILSAQAQAQQQHVGLWGACAVTETLAPPPSVRSAATSTVARVPQAAVAPRPAAPAAPAAPKPTTAARSNCHPSYTPCIPNGPDLDCPQIGFQVKVVGPDSYRLDADGDGTGCDSY